MLMQVLPVKTIHFANKAFRSTKRKKDFLMNETVTKRFLLYFRLMLLVWILIANAIIPM